MFILNGKPLSPDRAFTHNQVQYPANWLRLSSPAERAALGITEAPDAPSYDQRYYWGVGIPKDLDELKATHKAKQKQIAQSLLSPSDWVVVRGAEDPGKPPGQAIKAYRAAVRSVSSTREQEIDAVTTVEELVTQLGTLTPWPDVVSV